MEREMNPDFYIHCSQLAEEFYERTAIEQMNLHDLFLAQRSVRARMDAELEALKTDEILL